MISSGLGIIRVCEWVQGHADTVQGIPDFSINLSLWDLY